MGEKTLPWKTINFIILIIIVVIFLFLLISVYGTESSGADPVDIPEWRTSELTDVMTGEKFTINEYSGNPVLISAFTRLCPVCNVQQNEILRLSTLSNDSIIHIGVDIDFNDNGDSLKDYVLSNDFEGKFAVATPEFLAGLVSDFGQQMIQPVTAPLLVICPDGKRGMVFPAGIKPAEYIKEQISQGCPA